ncbi:MAG: rod shape-determining protein RodA [Prevotellaceae bacterium]|jgi:rod shape determining protein RodA|nr:rod shape-determining protein RodA [Prevotellaceae bacterium]
MTANSNVFKLVDKTTVILYLMLVMMGWMSIYVAGYNPEQGSIFDLSCRSGMQFVWIMISVSVAVVILLIDSQYYNILAYFIYAVVILLLVITIFAAPEIKGSRSWLVIGSFSIQPAEFAKFATALAVARMMNSYGFELNTARGWMKVLALILLPMICIVMQKEVGSALVFVAFMIVLYREGFPAIVPVLSLMTVILFILVIGLGETLFLGVAGASVGIFMSLLIILVVVIVLVKFYAGNKQAAQILWAGNLILFAGGLLVHFIRQPINFCHFLLVQIGLSAIFLIVVMIQKWQWKYLMIVLFAIGFTGYALSSKYLFEDVLEKHQRTRIKVMLGMVDDPVNVGYNVNQSRIAIGSGGFTGKGFLNGTQTKLKFVPEQDTDFIFCTIGEEWGFLGSVALILVYMFFILRLISLAEKQITLFARVYGYGVAAFLLLHVSINIGMTLGLMPVIGIPLPFFSYGGSSLLSFTILLFIFLRLDAARKR